MAQRCPFCKARLWTDPWFSRGRQHCPRCGNEFTPTVHWAYFRVLVLMVVILMLAILVFLPPGFFILVLFLVGLGIALWFFPRLVNLQPLIRDTRNGVPAAAGPSDPEWDDWDEKLEEKLEQLAEQSRFRNLLLLVLLLALILVVVAGLQSWFA